MKLSRGARRDNLFNSIFRCPSALALICMKLLMFTPINSLSLSLFLLLFRIAAGRLKYILKARSGAA